MDGLFCIIVLPLIVGIILFVLPDKIRTVKGIIAFMTAAISFSFCVYLYAGPNKRVIPDFVNGVFDTGPFMNRLLVATGKYSTLQIDELSKMIVLFVGFFAVLIALYSLIYYNRDKRIKQFYPYFLITLGASTGAVLADHLILFITFWGLLGLTLYKLIGGYGDESSAAAKKSLIIIGASDGIMILGIALVHNISNTYVISELNINTSTGIGVSAVICLLVGSFTKAGAFPFHSWIPDFTKTAPANTSAYLPASLDKLLGIYFLARILTDMFQIGQWLTLVILIIGVTTIITAVMMALVQHNYKRLLGYHAVSQVGYMVLGFGLGTPIGVVAGLFHMVNNTIYKSGLFLTSGNVEQQTGSHELDDLGGLSKSMPLTFIAALVFALSISGIPPLNGFASKWMIYQGIIEFGTQTGVANQLWMVWLVMVVLGSALTLASFIKFISGIFLGAKRDDLQGIKEVNFLMWLPMLVLAILCLTFGVFATNYVIPEVFMPVTGKFQYTGIWQSSIVSMLILVSIVVGFIIYLIGNIGNYRTVDSFIGGEKISEEKGFPVSSFYNTIKYAPFFSSVYKRAEKKWFDIYELFKYVVLGLSQLFSKAHTGVLTNYAFWVFIGMAVLLMSLL